MDRKAATANNIIKLNPRNDAFCLRFESKDDALRYAEHIADRCAALKRATGCYGVDHYLRGDSYLAIELETASGKFLFTFMRPGTLEKRKPRGLGIWNENLFDIMDKRNKRKVPMLGNSCQPTNHPEHCTFPMLIRLERAAEVNQGLIHPSAFLFNLILEVGAARSDREMEIWGKRGVDLQSGVGECMVECMAHIRNDISSSLLHAPSDWLKAHAVNVLTGLRVSVDDDVRFISLPKFSGEDVKVRRAFLSGFE